MLQLQSVKTIEERQTLIASPEFQALGKNHLQLPATLNPDGTFSVQDVPPGEYEFSIQPSFSRMRPGQMPTNFVVFASARNVTVSAPSAQDDNTPIDVGSLEMQPIPIPTFGEPSVKHRP